jgi:metal-sulfur cluster biosynthetic enzyme
MLAAAVPVFHDFGQAVVAAVRLDVFVWDRPQLAGLAARHRPERCLNRGARPVNDNELLQALKAVNDPEIGINIVDLGLVYRAERKPDGIEVAITLTTPSCPLGEMLLEETREALRSRFPDAPSIHVELVRSPPWSPDRMSEAARRQLG